MSQTLAYEDEERTMSQEVLTQKRSIDETEDEDEEGSKDGCQNTCDCSACQLIKLLHNQKCTKAAIKSLNQHHQSYKKSKIEPKESNTPHDERIKVKKLHAIATIPTKATETAAGYDLSNPTKITIAPFSLGFIKTHLAMNIPKGYYGQIAVRSGVAKRKCLIHLGGIIDSDYRGDIAVMLYNLLDEAVTIKQDEKFAQIVLIKTHESCDMKEVRELDNTERGGGGFGSTGH